MSKQEKLIAAKASLDFIEKDMVIGVGTGTTVDIFIEQLNNSNLVVDHKLTLVASSKDTAKKLQAMNCRLLKPHETNIDLYIDSADSFNENKELLKGLGGALTHEKILSCLAKKFICIVDRTKGPVPIVDTVLIEVIGFGRSVVAKELLKLGATPSLRENFLTDNGNYIIEAQNLSLANLSHMEDKLNSIPGVLENGIFAKRTPDLIIQGNKDKVLFID